MEKLFQDRIAVTLDFSKSASVSDLYGEMRDKMKWKSWYAENLDALWDILTGLPYYGDDFKIIRPRVFSDPLLTRKADAICDIFFEAQERFGKITADIDYVD